MSRIRTIKPEFFRHEVLYDAEVETKLPLRLAFIGLLTVVDRDGRFHWRPRTLKPDVLPYDEVDFSRVLDAFEKYGMVVRYEANGEHFGFIPSFKKHQHVNVREAKSTIPEPDTNVQARVSIVNARGEGKGKEQEGKGREGDSCSEPQTAREPPFEPVIRIPTNRKSEEFLVSPEQVSEFRKLYPAVDVEQELRGMRAWALSNPSKRKTAKGVPRFINSWLAKEQDRGGNGNRGAQTRADNSARGAARFVGADGGVEDEPASRSAKPDAGGVSGQISGTAIDASPNHFEEAASRSIAFPGRDLPVAKLERIADDPEIPSFLRRA